MTKPSTKRTVKIAKADQEVRAKVLMDTLAELSGKSLADLTTFGLDAERTYKDDENHEIKKGLLAIYVAVFDPEKPADAKKLATLLAPAMKPDNVKHVLDFLDQISAGHNPLNLPNILTLKDLFTNEKPLQPVPVADAPKINALEFWHKLVIGPVKDVEDLSKALHAYHASETAANRDEVLRWLTERKGISFDTNDEAYVNALLGQLVEIAVLKDKEYQFLAWWNVSQNMW
jgi:hypothetical protein